LSFSLEVDGHKTTCDLNGIGRFQEHQDNYVRVQAHRALFGVYGEHATELAEIYAGIVAGRCSLPVVGAAPDPRAEPAAT
jgi:oligoendopeptidase F